MAGLAALSAALGAIGMRAARAEGRGAAPPAGIAPPADELAPPADEVAPPADELAPPADGGRVAPSRASFYVAFRDIVSPYRVFLLTALPGERVRIRAVPGDARSAARKPVLASGAASPSPAIAGTGTFELEASAGSVGRISAGEWWWRAPERPGYYPLVLRRPGSPEEITLTGAVLVPHRRLSGGAVDGYRIGTYPRMPYRGLPQYERPRGFLRLAPEDAEVPVSPHFTLGQFPAKGPPGYPKYLVLGEKLLLKLELLLEEAAGRGLPVSRFRVLSGFRSPWYNAGIGRPRYSRHIYGDAADVYVDEDGDGRMDDLNGDGRIDVGDAGVLYDIVEEMDASAGTSHLIGGLGKYRVTPGHGPFIHVDTREYRARW